MVHSIQGNPRLSWTTCYLCIECIHFYSQHLIAFTAIFFQIKEITGTTADVFLEYIQRNLPEGVTMSVYQVNYNEIILK